MTISAILNGKGHDVIGLSPDTTVQQAAAILSEKRIGCVPIVEAGAVVGIFSERDVVRTIAELGSRALSAPVSDVMTSPAVTIAQDMPVMTALSLMTRRRIRHLPVIESGKMIGFVSIGDLVKYRIERIEAEASAMREYIQSA